MKPAEVLRNALQRAQAGEQPDAWLMFQQVAGDLGKDRDLALGFAELLRLDPAYPGALPLADRALAGFRQDASVIIPLAAALLRSAELRPADEPPFVQGPAHLVAGACQECFEALGSAARTDPDVGGYLQINMADALRMMGPEYDDDALKAYKLALTIDDARGGWWFQLGLFYKWRGRFREGLDANQKAYTRLIARDKASEPRAVLWNLAICATALGEGKLALEAWAKLGIQGELSASGMPFVPNMPPMQVRVATMGEEIGQADPLPSKAVTFELLWVFPLSPCHGVVQSPTARKASVDYGDVVLWDGAPVRVHEVDQRPVPVFPLLWILRAGEEQRLRFVGMQKDASLIDAVSAALPEGAHCFVFDTRTAADGAQLLYGKLIVPKDLALADVRKAVERAVHATPGLTLALPQLYELLGDTPAAGKAHQAWGGIERAAQKQGLLSAPPAFQPSTPRGQ
jgi:tetratricopeptide (TPR) repeat protein